MGAHNIKTRYFEARGRFLSDTSTHNAAQAQAQAQAQERYVRRREEAESRGEREREEEDHARHEEDEEGGITRVRDGLSREAAVPGAWIRADGYAPNLSDTSAT